MAAGRADTRRHLLRNRVNLILEDVDNLQEKLPEWSDGLVKALTYN
jgi:hypothetical protein